MYTCWVFIVWHLVASDSTYCPHLLFFSLHKNVHLTAFSHECWSGRLLCVTIEQAILWTTDENNSSDCHEIMKVTFSGALRFTQELLDVSPHFFSQLGNKPSRSIRDVFQSLILNPYLNSWLTVEFLLNNVSRHFREAESPNLNAVGEGIMKIALKHDCFWISYLCAIKPTMSWFH